MKTRQQTNNLQRLASTFSLGACALFFTADATAAGTASDWAVGTSGKMDAVIYLGGVPRFTIQHVVRGPGWDYKELSTLPDHPETIDTRTRTFKTAIAFGEGVGGAGPEPLRWDVGQTMRQTTPDSLEMVYDLTANRPFVFNIPKGRPEAVGTLSLVIANSSFLLGNTCKIELTDGKSVELTFPPGRNQWNGVRSATLGTPAGDAVALTFDPPVTVHCDVGELRFMLARAGETPAGEVSRHKLTVTLPQDFAFSSETRIVDTAGWFPVEVDTDFTKPSEIGMADWLEKPAGKRGWLKMDGDRIVHADGTPAILWGTNVLRVLRSQLNKEYLAASAAACEFYGININRLHAFAKPHTNEWAHMFKLMDPQDSFKFHEGDLDMFDYVFAEFKKRGIYTGWSVFYGWFPTAADKEQNRLINWDEAQKMLRKPFPREGSWYHLAGVMPDIQDLVIKWHVMLLEHKNPYTGQRYADDPALAFVELQNEENVYLNIREIDKQLANAPTYRDLYYKRFAKWLTKKYGDDDALRTAWGGLAGGESLAKANISPFPVWYNPAQPPPQRIADQYHFIYTTQREFYQKFVKAVRGAGYGGLLVGSCWQASDWIGHLYNLKIDAEVGMIDRHNYGRDHLDKPGTGLLSAGFQQLAGRPFNYSEWGGDSLVGQSVAAPITAFYGMGLQGWDGSQQFAWDHPGAMTRATRGINDSTNDFRNLAQYPALARSVLRGDVKQGDVAGLRRVSLPDLKSKGYVGFHEEFSLLGNANNKSFQAAVPQESLAVGRVLLEFVDGAVEKPVEDKTAGFLDRKARQVRSNTGQLLWDYSGAGYFTVNTPGTQGVVGFSKDITQKLDDVEIVSRTPYAKIYLTALDKTATLRDAKRILVTAIARGVDEGTRFEEFSDKPLFLPPAYPSPRLLMEPVKAEITLAAADKEVRVIALDHNGRIRQPEEKVPVTKTNDGIRFTLDGSKHKTVYYLVERH